MAVSASARIIAAALNTVSRSCEMPPDFRYHAKVLNEHLAEVMSSGMFDDIDDFFDLLEKRVCNRRTS
jgi:hypothetical protein